MIAPPVPLEPSDPEPSDCVECGSPTTDLDLFGQCFDCSDVLVPDVDTDLVCSECGNDTGPYAGLCLDCLEDSDSPGW